MRLADDVEGIAFLHWGEHCVECAAPACYSSCDLYQPRSDYAMPPVRLRRLSRIRRSNRMRGYGVEISFKKWAKIEAFGDTAIHPVNAVLRWERMVEAGAPIANVIGHLVKRATGKRIWDELVLHGGRKTFPAAERAREQRSAGGGISPRSIQSDRKRDPPAGYLRGFG